MSDASEYQPAATTPVERQHALAWLRGRLWWDARLAQLEAPAGRETAEIDQEPPAAQSRGAA
jgi:hypothetical protein